MNPLPYLRSGLTSVIDFCRSALTECSRWPLWVYALIGLGIFGLCSLPVQSDQQPPPDLVAAVRADLQTLNQSASTVAESSGEVLAEVKTHTQLLTEIRDSLTSGRRRAGESAISDPSSPLPPGEGPGVRASVSTPSITLPDGSPVELLTLASRATGRFTVEGGRYRASLISHGFRDSELPADEGQCRLIYDAWKSSLAPTLQTASGYQPPPQRMQWCSGGRCYRQ